jgi:hypothetical protein
MTAERLAQESRQTVLALLRIEREQFLEQQNAAKKSRAVKRSNRTKQPSISVRPCNSREAESLHP